MKYNIEHKDMEQGVWIDIFPRSAMFLKKEGGRLLVKEIEVTPNRFKGTGESGEFLAGEINVRGFGLDAGIINIEREEDCKVSLYEYSCVPAQIKTGEGEGPVLKINKYDEKAESDLKGMKPGDVGREIKKYVTETKEVKGPDAFIEFDSDVNRGNPRRINLEEAKAMVGESDISYSFYKK